MKIFRFFFIVFLCLLTLVSCGGDDDIEGNKGGGTDFVSSRYFIQQYYLPSSLNVFKASRRVISMSILGKQVYSQTERTDSFRILAAEHHESGLKDYLMPYFVAPSYPCGITGIKLYHYSSDGKREDISSKSRILFTSPEQFIASGYDLSKASVGVGVSKLLSELTVEDLKWMPEAVDIMRDRGAEFTLNDYYAITLLVGNQQLTIDNIKIKE